MKMTTKSHRTRPTGAKLPADMTLASLANQGQAHARELLERVASSALAAYPASEIEGEVRRALEKSTVAKLPRLVRHAARKAATYPLSEIEREVRHTVEKASGSRLPLLVRYAVRRAARYPLAEIERELRRTLEKSKVLKTSRSLRRAAAGTVAAFPLAHIEDNVRLALKKIEGANAPRKTLMAKCYSRRRWVLGVAAFYLVATVVARRRGYSGLGGRTLVRCRAGHLFRTIWIPGLSLKSVRLGWYRAQYCPVGRHWTVVKPVKEAQLSDEELAQSPVPVDISIP